MKHDLTRPPHAATPASMAEGTSHTPATPATPARHITVTSISARSDSGSTRHQPDSTDRWRRGRARWPRPLLVALAFAAFVIALDALVPGLPGAQADLLGRLTAFMSGICPQRPAHSYTLAGVQLPIEARMMGMFGGLLVGVAELATAGRKRSRRWPRLSVGVTLVLGLGVMAFDGFNALFFDLGLPHLYAPDLRVRLGTGILAGLAMAFALVPTYALVTGVTENEHEHDLDARDVRRENSRPGRRPAARPGWRDLGCAFSGGTLFAGGVASGWAPLLYPVALLGALGVVLAWLLINAILLAGLLGDMALARTLQRQVWRIGLLAAMPAILAVAELALLAMVRSRLQ